MITYKVHSSLTGILSKSSTRSTPKLSHRPSRQIALLKQPSSTICLMPAPGWLGRTYRQLRWTRSTSLCSTISHLVPRAGSILINQPISCQMSRVFSAHPKVSEQKTFHRYQQPWLRSLVICHCRRQMSRPRRRRSRRHQSRQLRKMWRHRLFKRRPMMWKDRLSSPILSHKLSRLVMWTLPSHNLR